MAQPAQRRQMPVLDARLPEGGLQGIALELRIAPRPRDCPHVHHLPDPVGGQQRQELGESPGGVPDGEERPGRPRPGG
jgi:hypothetical protein